MLVLLHVEKSSLPFEQGILEFQRNVKPVLFARPLIGGIKGHLEDIRLALGEGSLCLAAAR
jgi:hypothetical protein